MLEKVKDCPFCGSTPKIEPANPKIDGNAWGQVECINDKCPANPSVLDGENIADSRGSEEYKNAAIRRWNTRAT